MLLVAFGGPTRPEEVRPFLANVARGRSIPPERLDAVAAHYAAIGGASPLNALTFRQAEKLHAVLRVEGPDVPVYVGMRSWMPSLADTLARMAAAGVRRAAAVILSPHASEASRERYTERVEEARAALGARAPTLVWTAPWFDHPLFVAANADAATAALGEIPAERRAQAWLLFTAHSIPTAMAARGPYVAEIAATATAVAAALGRTRWEIAYQSRSGSPREPWLEPDVNDALRALAARGARDVVVSPIGFVADHVEVLYDLDVEARATARALGLGFVRAGTVNDHPLFVRMLAERVREAAR